MKKNTEAGTDYMEYMEMEENEPGQTKRRKASRTALFILMFFLSGVISGAGSYILGAETGEIIRNTVLVMSGTGAVIFSLAESELNDLYFYKNKGKYGKFTVFYLAGLALCLLFALLPVNGWPFLSLFVLLGLFSNNMTGLTAGSVCLMLSVLLSDGGSQEFFLYFLSGLVGIMVFSRLNAEFKVALPIFIALLSLALFLCVYVILTENGRIFVSQFTIAAINIIVNLILLLIILKIFSNTMIHKYNEKYMEINDPECPLLVQLKNFSRKEYYHAIHTAYLGDRIARQLKFNEMAVKACGYYHRIGILKGGNTWENVEEICREYHIPPDARRVLREYVDPSQDMVSRETAVILFADCIVTSITRLFEKEPKAELNYEQIINTIFDNKLKSGELNKSDISIAQLREMKRIFSEEKLYYDFLR